MSVYDVVIVGAGPAGCTAALDLANGGARVALIDKAVLPRYKTCGGGVLARAYAHLPRSVESIVERRFNSVQLNLIDQDVHLVASRPSPLVYMTMRADLDHLLAREAQTAGAHLMEQCAVNAIRMTGDNAELDTTRGIIRARAIVAADGVNSRVARAAGWRDSRRLIPALEAEIVVSEKEFARHGAAARFDFGVIDSGYGWVFPKRRHLSAGILTTKPGSINLHHELQRYLHLIGIRGILSIEKHGYTIPLSPRTEPMARDGIFLTGDAAGLADPVTAEGISNAVHSGRLAARAILAHSSINDAMTQYQNLVEKEILRDLKAARLLAGMLYRWPAVRNFGFGFSGEKLCDFMADVVAGTKNYRDAVRKPASYLQALGAMGW